MRDYFLEILWLEQMELFYAQDCLQRCNLILQKLSEPFNVLDEDLSALEDHDHRGNVPEDEKEVGGCRTDSRCRYYLLDHLDQICLLLNRSFHVSLGLYLSILFTNAII